MPRETIEYVVTAPLDFEAQRQRAHEYLARDVEYGWISSRKRSLVPIHACCIVLCGRTGSHKATARCLAFAHERNGRFHWFGITAAWQDPVELYGVTAFVPVANAAPMFV